MPVGFTMTYEIEFHQWFPKIARRGVASVFAPTTLSRTSLLGLEPIKSLGRALYDVLLDPICV